MRHYHLGPPLPLPRPPLPRPLPLPLPRPRCIAERDKQIFTYSRAHTSTTGNDIPPYFSAYAHNPRRACAARVTVVVLCVCLSVCLSVSIYSRTTGYEAAYERYQQLQCYKGRKNNESFCVSVCLSVCQHLFSHYRLRGGL